MQAVASVPSHASGFGIKLFRKQEADLPVSPLLPPSVTGPSSSPVSCLSELRGPGSHWGLWLRPHSEGSVTVELKPTSFVKEKKGLVNYLTVLILVAVYASSVAAFGLLVAP